MIKKLKALLCLMVPAAIFYAAILFSLPYYRYYTFESDARDVLRFEVRSNEEMTKKILQLAEDQGIPITESSLAVYQDDEGRYNARAAWSETVNLLNLYSRTYNFKVDVGSEEMKRRRR